MKPEKYYFNVQVLTMREYQKPQRPKCGTMKKYGQMK